MALEFKPEPREGKPRITVFGVGGAGGNAVNNMISGNLEGVEFVVANTDAQALQQSLAPNRVQLGTSITHGLGAGARPDIGKVAAEEALSEIQLFLEGNNMVFIAAGMGGGTGTGAAPVIARAAQEQGILTVGVVTKPFQFEGIHRMRLAEQGIQELHQHVDTLIVIPNQNLFRIANERTTFADAFKLADDVLHAGVRGVTDLMVNPGLINLDFADIRTVMAEMGKAMMGTGEADGENRAIEAAEAAISNPLLDNASIEGACGVLINITGGADMTLHEVDMAATRIGKEVAENANVIFGARLDPSLEGLMRVSVIATGIEGKREREPIPEADKIYVLGSTTSRRQASGGGQPNRDSAAQASGGREVSASAAGATSPLRSASTVASTVASTPAAAPSAASPASSPSPAPVAAIPTPQPPAPASSPATFGEPRLSSEPVREQPRGRPAASANEPFLPPAPVEPVPSRLSAEPAKGSYDPVAAADLLNAGKQAKRGGSLFTRITGNHRGGRDGEEAGLTSRPASETQRVEREPLLGGLNRPASKPASEAPKAATPAEDPLDIPAFLRRQAN